MADPKECAAVAALRRPCRTPEDDRLKGNWYYFRTMRVPHFGQV